MLNMKRCVFLTDVGMFEKWWAIRSLLIFQTK